MHNDLLSLHDKAVLPMCMWPTLIYVAICEPFPQPTHGLPEDLAGFCGVGEAQLVTCSIARNRFVLQQDRLEDQSRGIK